MDAWDHFTITIAREYNVSIEMAKSLIQKSKK